VALDDVSHLVGEDSRHLVLAIRQRQQPAGNVDPATGHGEGVRITIVGHAPLPGDVRASRRLPEARADRLDVLGNPRLAHETHGPLDLFGFLAADAALCLRRHRGAGAGGEPAQ
jgi:hypothetical protein